MLRTKHFIRRAPIAKFIEPEPAYTQPRSDTNGYIRITRRAQPVEWDEPIKPPARQRLMARK
jgi:hypothetical protein